MGIHIRIWETLTFRVRRVFHPQQTNLFDKPKGAPGEPTEEEESNRTEPNWRTKSRPRRQPKNDQTARRFLTDWRHRKTELNRTRKRKFRTQCAAQCAMRSETDKPTSRRADKREGRGNGKGGGRRERPSTVARPWRTRESLLRGSLSVLSRRRAESNKQVWMYLDTLSVMSFPQLIECTLFWH